MTIITLTLGLMITLGSVFITGIVASRNQLKYEHGSAKGTRAGAASVMAAMAANPDGRPRLFMVCGPHVWGSSAGHLEGRQLGRMDVERCELLPLII
jgi:hypothetical protein